MKFHFASSCTNRTTTSTSNTNLAILWILSSVITQCDCTSSDHHHQDSPSQERLLVDTGGDGCRDSLHHDCAAIVENDDCNDPSKSSGYIYGDTFCPVSCGRCNVIGNTIMTDSECYSFGQQEIVVSFTNVDPTNNDWIGIYKDNSNNIDSDITEEDYDENDHLDELVAWYWLCGNKRDRCKVGIGSVTVPWLPPGSYRAVLARNTHLTKGPTTKHDKDARYAQSPMFGVVRGAACASRQRKVLADDVGSDGVEPANDESAKNANLRWRRRN
jgi:hypothetical protein